MIAVSAADSIVLTVDMVDTGDEDIEQAIATVSTMLTDAELLELWDVIRRTKEILDFLFRPDHYNYSFLMSLDSHVHLHTIPRYKTVRVFEGVSFHDTDEVTENRLGERAHNRLVQSLREVSSNLA